MNRDGGRGPSRRGELGPRRSDAALEDRLASGGPVDPGSERVLYWVTEPAGSSLANAGSRHSLSRLGRALARLLELPFLALALEVVRAGQANRPVRLLADNRQIPLSLPLAGEHRIHSIWSPEPGAENNPVLARRLQDFGEQDPAVGQGQRPLEYVKASSKKVSQGIRISNGRVSTGFGISIGHAGCRT